MIFTMLWNTHYRPITNADNILKIASYTCNYSKQYDLDPVLILSIQRHESNYKPWARSKSKDCGLMQLHDSDGDCKQKCNLRTIHCNIRKGAKFLHYTKKNCLKKHKHKYWIRHYNWGSKKHYWKILWLTRAFKEAFLYNSPKIYKAIRTRSYSKKKYPECIIKHNLCIH